MFVKSYDPATDVTARAVSLAGETDRNVLLHFYADWCNWCRHLDAAFESCEVLTVLQKHLVLVTIVEDGGPDGDENPGAWELRRELGGATSGVPFLAVLGADGEKITDSRMVGGRRGNIGCPNTPAEIAAFGEMLKVAAPRLADADREKVLDYFRDAPWRRASIRG